MYQHPQYLSFFFPALFNLFHHVLASEIDFRFMPKCAIEPCLPFHASSIGCTKFTKSCFCSALAPLNCARSNCTGNDWYMLEDWYSTQCPGDPPLVPLDPGIPLAARKCARQKFVPSQCKASITRNCFCRVDNATTMITDCLASNTGATEQQAAGIAGDFYRGNCVLKEDAAGEVRPGSATEEEIIAAPQTPSSAADDDPKIEKLGLIVGLVAGFIAIAGVVRWFFVGCCCGVSAQSLATVRDRDTRSGYVTVTDFHYSKLAETCCAARLPLESHRQRTQQRHEIFHINIWFTT